MRISDWSSDVCSSDLQVATLRQQGFVVARQFAAPETVAALRRQAERQLAEEAGPIEYEADLQYPGAPPSRQAQGGSTVRRSEEHTSELQSLMRISYAVFCLNKKKK